MTWSRNITFGSFKLLAPKQKYIKVGGKMSLSLSPPAPSGKERVGSSVYDASKHEESPVDGSSDTSTIRSLCL
jgi:hypothetical protein